MERYTFDGDGVFNVVPEWNTSTTTVTIGSIPDGATVAVGVASTDGWSPLDGGQLVSGSTTTLTHGHDAQLQVLISGLVGLVSLDFRKEGVPSQHNLLEQIVQNTASPIKEEAPVGGHWRNDGTWELDPIQEDAPQGRHARDGNGGWVDLEPDLAKITDKAEWEGAWSEGEYQANALVRDGDWTMIANTLTNDRPAPQKVGVPDKDVEDGTAFLIGSNLSVVYSGHLYTFTQGGAVTTLRIKVPTLSQSTNYRIRTILDPFGTPRTSEFNDPLLVENGWATIALGNTFVSTGDQLLVYIDAYDSSSTTTWQYPWTFGAIGASTAPLAGQWTRNNSSTSLRISKTDGDGVDHTQELRVVPNSTFTITQLNDPNKWAEYTVLEAPVDQGTYYEYAILQTDEGLGGSPDVGVGTQIRAEQPVVATTEYVEAADYWLSNQPQWATVQGFLEFDGVTEPGHGNDAYGIQLTFQPYSTSPDWDFVAYSGSAATGGAGEAPSATVPTTIAFGNDNTLVTPADAAANYVLAQIDTLMLPPGYEGLFTADATTGTFTYTGNVSLGFKITASGSVVSDSTGNTDHIFVRLREVSGIMTGSSKRYSAGRADGNVTSDVGFNTVGFGLFDQGDTVQIELAKDFTGNITLTDLIVELRAI